MRLCLARRILGAFLILVAIVVVLGFLALRSDRWSERRQIAALVKAGAKVTTKNQFLPMGWETKFPGLRTGEIVALSAGPRTTLEMLGQACELQSLTNLRFDVPFATDINVRAFINACNSTKRKNPIQTLRFLLLVGPGISDEAVKAISVCKNLEWLDLRETAISDVSLPVIGGLPRLQDLRLNDTKITSTGIGSLLGSNRKLPWSSLDLSRTHITDNALGRLSLGDGVCDLNLSGCEISDKGLERIGSVNRLTRLDLTNTSVTLDGIERLLAMRPTIKVIAFGIEASPERLAALRSRGSILITSPQPRGSGDRCPKPGVKRHRHRCVTIAPTWRR